MRRDASIIAQARLLLADGKSRAVVAMLLRLKTYEVREIDKLKEEKNAH